jgi:hypothetical protein
MGVGGGIKQRTAREQRDPADRLDLAMLNLVVSKRNRVLMTA